MQENHIVGKSICKKNLSQKILLQENHIPGNTSSLASSFFVLFFAKRQKSFRSKRSPLRQRERSDRGPRREKGHACLEKAKRQKSFKRKRSPLQRRERSDRGPSQKKGHTCLEKAKRPSSSKSRRSLVPEKWLCTEGIRMDVLSLKKPFADTFNNGICKIFLS